MVEFLILRAQLPLIILNGGVMKRKFNSACAYLQKTFVVVGVMLAFMHAAFAVNLHSAVGYWETTDDANGKLSSIIRVWYDKKDKVYLGKIYKIFPENGHKTSDLCVKCKGAQHDKPMLGLMLITAMVYEDGKYVHGYVLDPRYGKLYHAKMWLSKDGEILNLRGYVGIPLFGKTAKWRRAPKNIL